MSKPGVGSKFVFFVEAKRTAAPELPQNTHSVEMALPVLRESCKIMSPSALRSTANGFPERSVWEQDTQAKRAKKILIVEDNAINATLLSKQLRKRGYEIDVAVHGEEALRLLQATAAWHASTREANPAFDLVLMEMSMPVSALPNDVLQKSLQTGSNT